jgi:ATP-dependent Clp protease protease subunit
MRDTLNKIIAEATGQTLDRIERDVDRDYILGPAQALEYGLIDKIVSSASDVSRGPEPVLVK